MSAAESSVVTAGDVVAHVSDGDEVIGAAESSVVTAGDVVAQVSDGDEVTGAAESSVVTAGDVVAQVSDGDEVTGAAESSVVTADVVAQVSDGDEVTGAAESSVVTAGDVVAQVSDGDEVTGAAESSVVTADVVAHVSDGDEVIGAAESSVVTAGDVVAQVSDGDEVTGAAESSVVTAGDVVAQVSDGDEVAAPVSAFSASAAPSSRTTATFELIRHGFVDEASLKREFFMSNRSTVDYLWQNRDKIMYCKNTRLVCCYSCKSLWVQKLEAYGKSDHRFQNIDKMVLFTLPRSEFTLSRFNKHLTTFFCRILSTSTAEETVRSLPTALESLILLAITQCKAHIAASNTESLVQWAVISGLHRDIVQGWSTNTNLKMRMVIARYALHIFYSQISDKTIKYIHIGLDNQHMSFNQKWMNIFVRYCVDGRPMSMTLGVQRVFGGSSGEKIFDLVKGLVTGAHLGDYIQTGSTLQATNETDETEEGNNWGPLITNIKAAG